MKSVQIPYDLFIDLAMYHLRGEDDFEEEIRQGLEQKLDAMLNRQLYSRYKTAPTEEEREQARQETAAECRKAIAVLLLLGSCDRSVPRSCGWQTRQSGNAQTRCKRMETEIRKAARADKGFHGGTQTSAPQGQGIHTIHSPCRAGEAGAVQKP